MTRTGLSCVGLGLLWTACAKPSPVTLSRPMGERIELQGEPVVVVEAALVSDNVQLRAIRRTPFDTHARIEVVSGQRYTWDDVKGPALGWGLAAVATAGIGAGVYVGEETQFVETARASTGEAGTAVETESRTVPPSRRIGSTTTFALAGGAGAVALGQVGAMALPIQGRRETERREFESRRWQEAPAASLAVGLRVGGQRVAAAQTDAAGEAALSLSRLAEVSDWAWTADVVAGPADTVEATVDLRASVVAGEAAGRLAVGLLQMGDARAGRALLDPLAADHAAHAPAWSAWCGGAGAQVSGTDTPRAAKVLRPPAGLDACAPPGGRPPHARRPAGRSGPACPRPGGGSGVAAPLRRGRAGRLRGADRRPRSSSRRRGGAGGRAGASPTACLLDRAH